MTPRSKNMTPGDTPADGRPALTIGAGFARGLMALAVTKGANPTLLAERAGIDPRQLQAEDARIPFASYVALMRAGQELSGDPALALHYGETIDFAEVSIVGMICDAA